MISRVLLVSLIAIQFKSLLVHAQTPDPFINTPEAVSVGLPVLLTFGGTHPPFRITTHPEGHPELPALVISNGTFSNNVSWPNDLAPGSYYLAIWDDVGATHSSAPFDVQSLRGTSGLGSSTAMTTASPSTSSSSPSTAANTLTAASSMATTYSATALGTSTPARSQEASPTNSRNANGVRILAGCIGGVLVVLILVALFIWLRRRYQRQHKVDLFESGEGGIAGNHHPGETEAQKVVRVHSVHEAPPHPNLH